MPHVRRLAPVLAATALLATAATACDPPPPPPTFVVTADASGPDAAPGDGDCATSDGGCSFEAAVMETNALGEARISLAAPGAFPPSEVELTGTAEVWGLVDEGSELDTVLTVGGSGGLHARDVVFTTLTVHGGAVVDRAGAYGDEDTTEITVGPTGTLYLRNAFVMDWAGHAVDNAGSLTMVGSTILVPWDAGASAPAAITTRATGTTTLGGVAVVGGGEDPAPTCDGPVVSLGYNTVSDGSCALDGPGDLEGLAEDEPAPESGSARIDRIPVGALACGTGWTRSINRHPRPLDGDGDGTAACDTGAWEIGSDAG